MGKVDCLINGAGGNKAAATTGPDLKFFDLPADALRWVFDLNILGTMLPCQAFGKIMAEQGHGTILNISSMNSFRPLTRIPAYSGAKAAVSNFTQWLAVHMAQEYSPKIRVNAVAPGFFLTNQNRFLLTDKETGELTKRGNSDHCPHAHGPLRRTERSLRRRPLAALSCFGVCHRNRDSYRRRLLRLQRRLSSSINTKTNSLAVFAETISLPRSLCFSLEAL